MDTKILAMNRKILFCHRKKVAETSLQTLGFDFMGQVIDIKLPKV